MRQYGSDAPSERSSTLRLTPIFASESARRAAWRLRDYVTTLRAYSYPIGHAVGRAGSMTASCAQLERTGSAARPARLAVRTRSVQALWRSVYANATDDVAQRFDISMPTAD